MGELAVRGKIPALSVGPFVVTRTGLIVERVPEWKEWQAFFDGMQKLADFRQWNVGDALKMIDVQYGEAAAQLTDNYPEHEYKTLRQYMWVAEHVEFARRRANLTWSHHAEVTKLEPAEQDEWLEKAERKDWSVRDLRQAIKGSQDSGRAWLRVYNVWNFGFRDERYGIGHPGNIPAQILMNLNYYYTDPGDLIVDLFAGGGVTIDVCESEDPDFGQRKCLAYDIEPARIDIQRWDMVTQGLPSFEDAKMIFLDPPYWQQKQGEYSSHETNLANLGLDEFHDVLIGIIQECLARADYVALIIGGSEFLGGDRRGKDHAGIILGNIKSELIQRIIVPYTTQQYAAHDVVRAKKGKHMLNLYRDLMVWQKS